MKPLLSLFLILMLAGTAAAQIQPPTPKPPTPAPAPVKKFKAVAPAGPVKAGDHIVIDASSATGAVFFFFDEVAFPKTRATQLGKVMVLSTAVNGTYVVNVASLDDKAKERVEVKVTGGIDPPPGPDPPDPPMPPVVDPIERVIARLDALAKVMTAGFTAQQAVNDVMRADSAAIKDRLLVLEKKPIPPPVNAIVKHVTFVGAEANAVSLAINNDAGLRTLMKNAGVGVHVLKKDDPLITSAGLAVAVKKAGGVPCVVLQDDLGNVIAQGPMTSVQQVQDLITQFIKR